MKIGIDMRAINEGAIHRGIGKYITSLIRLLNQIDHQNEYYLFLLNHQADFAQSSLPHNERWHFIFLIPSTIRQKRFIRTIALGHDPLYIDKYGLDVVFQQDKNYPIRSRKTPIVSIIHDLIPMIFSSEYQAPIIRRSNDYVGNIVYLKEKRKRQMENNAMAKAHSKSDHVIAISNHTAKDAIKFGNLSPEKITVIPHGAETIQSTKNPRAPKGLKKNQDFIFYVGGMDPRKRIPYLIKQFATISNKYPDLRLIIGGKEGTNKQVPQTRLCHKLVKDLNIQNKVLFTGYLDDAELDYLYQNAVAFVLTSNYEGFGMQILEAFLAGCPVVAYSNSSIPEVAGDAAILLDKAESPIPILEKLLSNSSIRKELSTRGKERAHAFTWKATAEQTLAVLEKVAMEKKR